jgi:2-polyprenyl-3-methyl-5-hydroxy-6-metoxy-1,4-benzoquinol methylase
VSAAEPTSLGVVLPILQCPNCSASQWRVDRRAASASLRCGGCGASSRLDGDIIWLHEADVHEEVRQERASVKPTEEVSELGGWRERYESVETVDRGLRDAYLSLPYGNGSSRFREVGYFANVSRFAPEFDFVLSQLPSGGRLLDLGADGTWSTARLASRGFACVALDITDHLRLGDLYQTTCPHYARVNVDMHADVFRPGSFDVVTAFNALHHSKRLPELARRIAANLADGGTLAFVEPYVQCEPQATEFGAPQADIGINENIHTLDAWHRAFTSAGLSLIAYAVSDAFCGIYRKAARTGAPALGRIQDGGLLQGYYDSRLTVAPALARASGSRAVFDVTVRNESRAAWASRGPWPVRLAYHLLKRENGSERMVAFDSPRTEIPSFVAPGTSATFRVDVPVDAAGEYVVEFDLVQEAVTWFAERGGSPGRATCVSG